MKPSVLNGARATSNMPRVRNAKRRARGPAQAPHARGRAPQRGAVYLEALLTLTPLLMLLLGLTQLSLLISAKLVVQHAATRAVRSAVVVLEDAHADYGEPPGHLTYPSQQTARGRSQRRSELPRFTQAATGGGALESLVSASSAGERESDGGRLALIRRAAHTPLSALTPPLSVLAGSAGSVAERRVGLLARFAAGLAGATGSVTAVTLREEPGSDRVVNEVGPDDLVTAHVAYLYRCNIPIARRLMCRSGVAWLTGWDTAVAGLTGLFGMKRENASSRKELKAEDRRFAQEMRHVEHPTLMRLALTRGHYALLEAEASLPNQGASYAR